MSTESGNNSYVQKGTPIFFIWTSYSQQTYRLFLYLSDISKTLPVLDFLQNMMLQVSPILSFKSRYSAYYVYSLKVIVKHPKRWMISLPRLQRTRKTRKMWAIRFYMKPCWLLWILKVKLACVYWRSIFLESSWAIEIIISGNYMLLHISIPFDLLVLQICRIGDTKQDSRYRNTSGSKTS